MSRAGLGTDDVVQALDDLGQLFRAHGAESWADSLHGQRANLADLHPGLFWKALRLQLQRERKGCALRLARECHGDHRARPFIEDIMAEDQHRPPSGLFLASDGVEFRPPDLTPQYSGHVATSVDRPSSASVFSKTGSSFKHSLAKRL